MDSFVHLTFKHSVDQMVRRLREQRGETVCRSRSCVRRRLGAVYGRAPPFLDMFDFQKQCAEPRESGTARGVASTPTKGTCAPAGPGSLEPGFGPEPKKGHLALSELSKSDTFLANPVFRETDKWAHVTGKGAHVPRLRAPVVNSDVLPTSAGLSRLPCGGPCCWAST